MWQQNVKGKIFNYPNAVC